MWEEYKETFREKMKASDWAFDKIKEAFILVAQNEAREVSIVLTTCGASSHQSEDRVESQCPTCARIATVSLWKTTFRGSPGERPQCGGAQFVEKGTTGENQTGCWSCKQAKVLSRQWCSKRMRYLKACAQTRSMR